MKMKKRMFTLVLAILMCLMLLSSCNGNKNNSTTTDQPSQPPQQSQQPSPTPGATSSTKPPEESGAPNNPTVAPPPEAVYAEKITIIISNNKISVLDACNPGSAADTVTWSLNALLDRLFEIDNANIGEYKNGLALSYETKDMQHVTFKLRDDVYFHNGEKFTAQDVAFTIDRAKENPGTNIFDRMNKIESYEIVNDYTITINYAKVNVDFIADLAAPHCGIVSKNALTKDPDKGFLIGTGPWAIAEFVPDDFVRFVRNDKYWGELPKTKEMTFKFIAEESTRLTMLENKDVQVAFSINPMDFPYLEQNTDKFDTYSWIVNNVGYLAFNMTDPITSDINFRRAVASAIVRSDMILTGRNGYAVEPDHGSFWGYGTDYKNTDIPRIPYDLAAAKAYLEQSNYDGSTIKIFAAISDYIKMAEVLQQQLKKIGVESEVVQTDTVGLAAATKWGENKTQIILHTGTWLVPASSGRIYFAPGGSNNRASYSNQEVVDLFDRAQTTVNEAERKAMYRKIQEIVAEDLAYLSICNIRHIAGALKGVGGLSLNQSSNHNLSYTYQVIG